MISCRPYYLPRELSAIFFVVGYLPPQTNVGTKTALLYRTMSKQENAHPEAALLVAGDFNAGKLKSIFPHYYQHINHATRGERTRSPLLHTQMHTKFSLTLHLANLTITLSS
jgi:ribosome assembly protein 1